ncbi:ABC transporter ATP-binding protein [Teredinibacter turnerae]|uniref:ABC transporter ATP-binding protein n=1 Tax=Teredinibacter turnerae TaxID=2426 RepID=UPI00035D1FD2|nr:ABC transporter ATP-binding protein [Teredinibacter turnerae]
MIHVKNLSRRYGDFAAVDKVTFSINSGEIVGLLGHNGAGKTTIMKMITGFLEPSEGSIEINNLPINQHAKEIQQDIGYLPENLPVYPELSVLDYLFYCAQVRNIPADRQQDAVAAAVRKTELAEKAMHPISTLSRGFKQRVGVAQALIHNPKILILDEPTNGLDPHQTQQMRNLVRSLATHATVIISTHIMQEVDALCDRALILDNGQLAIDQTLASLRRSDTLALSSSISGDKLNAILGEKYGALTAQQITADEYRIQLPETLDEKQFASWLAEQLMQSGEKIYAINPLLRDLETVFRSIHQQKHHQGDKTHAA